jgi:5-methylcytosine-specific restriction endonuclease McrA
MLHLQKQAPARLAGKRYRDLYSLVLRRDGWRCQMCGSGNNLNVHHQQYRSHSGEDVEQNLITLCDRCHRQVHGNG